MIELVGALNFAAIDYVTRRLAGEPPNAPLLILDFRRVPDLTAAGAQLLGEKLTMLGNAGVTAIMTGVEATSAVWTAVRARIAEPERLRRFAVLDDAIEWAEDQVIYRYGGFTSSKETSHLGEQALLADLIRRRSRHWPSSRPRAATRPASASSAPASPPTRCSSCRAEWSA